MALLVLGGLIQPANADHLPIAAADGPGMVQGDETEPVEVSQGDGGEADKADEANEADEPEEKEIDEPEESEPEEPEEP